MEEKKRVRPTWAMVRELEKKFSDQLDITSSLVADCNGWREKYRSVLADVKAAESVEKSLRQRNDELECRVAELEERIARGSDNAPRGFWSRLFGR